MPKTDDVAELSVPLTVEERADRAEMMAGLVQQIRAVKAQAKTKAFEYREQIEALMDRLEAHARVLMEGEESRRQMDLTFPQEQAARALHDVAAAACTCEPGDEDGPEVADPACPVHGVERREDGTAKDRSEREPEDGPDVEALASELREDIGAAASTTESRPEEPEPPRAEDDDPEPVGEQVDVGTVQEPESVGRFRRGRRPRSASGSGGAA